MATTRVQIEASPDDVFAVLAEPDSYGHRVVGSDTIRDADLSWPEVGSRFHHRVGFGLLKLNDHTEVLEADPPHLVHLRNVESLRQPAAHGGRQDFGGA